MPHSPYPIITDQPLLEPLSEQHFPALYEISKKTNNIEDYQRASPDHAYFLRWAHEARDEKTQSWTVLMDGCICGLVSLENVIEPVVELRYFIVEDYQNKGIGSEAIKAVINNTSSAMGHVRTIHAQVTASNIASGRVLVKNGFRQIRAIR